MNRLNWIQQEQKVADYHVITWRTSHFHHPRNRTDIMGSFNSKLEGGASAGAGAQQQSEGIGVGLEEPFGNAKWKSGGLGTDGIVQDGTKNAVNNEVLSVSAGMQGRRMTSPESMTAAQTTMPESVAAVMQTVVPEEVYSVVNSARRSVLKIHSRLKQSVAKLRDLYLRHQEKQKRSAGTSALHKSEYRKQSDDKQKGTRRADRDELLSVQAENSFLLDSYNKNGQYSVLGK